MRLAVELALLGLLGLLGLLACVWGSSYLFIKVALSSIPPVSLIAMRVAIAALFLLGVIFLDEQFAPEVGLGLLAIMLGVAAINVPGFAGIRMLSTRRT